MTTTQPLLSSAVETQVRARVRTSSSTGHDPAGDCRIDLSFDAATITIDFSGDGAPGLTIGQWVQLDFEAGPGHPPITARAKAMSWRTGGDTQTYTFHVDREESAPLSVLVSRRAEERVRVDLLNPVRASIGDAQGRCRQGLMHDLSLGGCALLFENEEPWMLGHSGPLRLSFDVFPGEPPLELEGELRSRRLNGLQVLFGFAFGEGQVEEEQVYDRLQRFLELRAQEIELLSH